MTPPVTPSMTADEESELDAPTPPEFDAPADAPGKPPAASDDETVFRKGCELRALISVDVNAAGTAMDTETRKFRVDAAPSARRHVEPTHGVEAEPATHTTAPESASRTSAMLTAPHVAQTCLTATLNAFAIAAYALLVRTPPDTAVADTSRRVIDMRRGKDAAPAVLIEREGEGEGD